MQTGGDIWSQLPGDVQTAILAKAGAPARGAHARRVSCCWRDAVAAMITGVNISTRLTLPLASQLLSLSRLQRVDLSGVCRPLPPPPPSHAPAPMHAGAPDPSPRTLDATPAPLATLLALLAHLPRLSALTLSTWCLAQALPLGTPAPGRQAPQRRAFSLGVPAELALLSGLQELVIGPCPGVALPCTAGTTLSSEVSQLNALTSLQLRGFLPAAAPCWLEGLPQLRHLALRGEGVLALLPAALTLRHLTTLEVEVDLISKPALLDGAGVQAKLAALWRAVEAQRQPCFRRGADARSPSDARRAAACSACGMGASGGGASGVRERCPTPAPGTALERVSLTLMHLDCVPPPLLQMARLRSVSMRGNLLRDTPCEALGGLTQLTSLDASFNVLSRVPASWAALTQLQEINLSHNVLSGPGALEGLRLPALTLLAVRDNGLAALPPDLDLRTPRLRHLDLRSNRLQVLPAGVWRLSALTHLDARHNRLACLPSAAADLASLRSFHVTGNYMATLPSALSSLTGLSHLGIGLNYLTTLHPGLLLPLHATLRDLDLQHSATVLKDAGPWLASLGRLTALTSLCASCNNLHEVPREWCALRRLRVLRLAHNLMDALPPGLCTALTRLEVLELCYNRLKALPEDIGLLLRLRSLSAAKNHLAALPPGLLALTALTELAVPYNGLTGLPPGMGRALCSLRSLDLASCHHVTDVSELLQLQALCEVVLPARYQPSGVVGRLLDEGLSVTFM